MDMAQHNIRIIIMAVATAKISVMNAAIPIFNSNLLLSTATAFHLHRTIHFGGVHMSKHMSKHMSICIHPAAPAPGAAQLSAVCRARHTCLCVDMCVDICVDMCIDMCIDMHVKHIALACVCVCMCTHCLIV